jgi:hypothetical protein
MMLALMAGDNMTTTPTWEEMPSMLEIQGTDLVFTRINLDELHFDKIAASITTSPTTEQEIFLDEIDEGWRRSDQNIYLQEIIKIGDLRQSSLREVIRETARLTTKLLETDLINGSNAMFAVGIIKDGGKTSCQGYGEVFSALFRYFQDTYSIFPSVKVDEAGVGGEGKREPRGDHIWNVIYIPLQDGSMGAILIDANGADLPLTEAEKAGESIEEIIDTVLVPTQGDPKVLRVAVTAKYRGRIDALVNRFAGGIVDPIDVQTATTEHIQALMNRATYVPTPIPIPIEISQWWPGDPFNAGVQGMVYSATNECDNTQLVPNSLVVILDQDGEGQLGGAFFEGPQKSLECLETIARKFDKNVRGFLLEQGSSCWFSAGVPIDQMGGENLLISVKCSTNH